MAAAVVRGGASIEPEADRNLHGCGYSLVPSPGRGERPVSYRLHGCLVEDPDTGTFLNRDAGGMPVGVDRDPDGDCACQFPPAGRGGVGWRRIVQIRCVVPRCADRQFATTGLSGGAGSGRCSGIGGCSGTGSHSGPGSGCGSGSGSGAGVNGCMRQ